MSTSVAVIIDLTVGAGDRSTERNSAERTRRPSSGWQAEVMHPPSNPRVRITVLAVPIVMLTIAVWVGNALAPTLVVDAPYLLLALSPRLELAALVSQKVSPVVYYLLPLARASMVLISWYFLGRWYNDRALRWAEDRSGKAAKPLLWVERHFNRARYPITFLFPINITAMLAGAGNMNPFGFFGVALTDVG